ncbi:MAG TPA: MauE/DoxX family redox-associated membrane protein [Steroidobacteraceae bacterium]|nr:MauE/DoxX family redox-associated membrane protein [Steroidobacteraceae bacterium]
MDPFLNWTLALSLAALFFAAVVEKVLAWREWPGVVRGYRLLPDRLADSAAALVLVAEMLAAAMLLWTRTRPAGGLSAAALLLLFAGALAINIRRGRTHIDCGCFGRALRQSLAPWMVHRNLITALLALTLLLPVRPRALTVLDWIACAGCALSLAFLYPVAALVLGGLRPLEDRAPDGVAIAAGGLPTAAREAAPGHGSATRGVR